MQRESTEYIRFFRADETATCIQYRTAHMYIYSALATLYSQNEPNNRTYYAAVVIVVVDILRPCMRVGMCWRMCICVSVCV